MMNFRLFTACIIVLLFVPGLVSAAESSQELQSAGALYSKSVDLANEGKYSEALQAADQALALNVSSLMPVIQANRAGILTVTGRYDEALIAAEASLAADGNLTTTHSIILADLMRQKRHLHRHRLWIRHFFLPKILLPLSHRFRQPSNHRFRGLLLPERSDLSV
jgi:tetratricopeptide (TPR) repeat protein